MVERARAAAAAGLDSLFVGDHHVTPQPYFQNTAILGRLLAEWDDRTAGALYLLPLWHPVLVAEQISTLAAIAEGPFVLQCALGEGWRQFAAFGLSEKQRPSRFEQSLDLIRRLLAGEEVAHEGRFTISGARISPLPPTSIAVWIGASAPVAIDRAARLGDGWIASPTLVPEEARRQLEQYRECCESHGREPGPAVIRRDIYVGANESEAKAIAQPVVAGGYRGIDSRALLIGSAAQVADKMSELAEIGYDEVLVRNLVPGAEHPVACIERLAEVRGQLSD